MNILVLSDLHGQHSILPKLDKYLSNNKFCAVFMCGDLCNAHDPNNLVYANNFIDLITVKNKTPLCAIHGNQETDTVKSLYRQKNVTVHFNPKPLSTYEVDSNIDLNKPYSTYEVVGVGYGDVFPLDPKFAKGKILLTHEPPRVETIKIMQSKINFPNAPILHFCGHLHNTAKITKVGKTKLVQVPTAQNFRAAICELPGRKVRFIHY